MSELMSGLKKFPQTGLQPCADNGRSQTWGSPCQTEAISSAMESTPGHSGPPTAAEGCRDIDRLPITMEYPTVTCQEGRRKWLPACLGPTGSQQCLYHVAPHSF
jgi:hypothetical protein